MSLIQDKLFELEVERLDASINTLQNISSQSGSILPEQWDLFPEFGYWYASRSENLGLEFDGLNVTCL